MLNLTDYFKDITQIASSLDCIKFESILNELKQAVQRRQTIYVAGNSSSSILASHFATDVIKNSSRNISSSLGIGIKVISLSECMPFFTATANDVCPDSAYAHYLKTFAEPGDLLLLFSPNVPYVNLIEAARWGLRKGLYIISITGATAGDLAMHSDILYSIDSHSLEQTEIIHTFLCHSLAVQLRNQLTMPVVFINSDCIIKIHRNDDLRSNTSFEYLPGVVESIRKLSNHGYAVVAINNQTSTDWNTLAPESIDKIHDTICRDLLRKGALLSKIYYCATNDYDNVQYHKNNQTIIYQAFDELPLEKQKGIIIGMRQEDITSGMQSGLSTVLITDTYNRNNQSKIVPDYFASDITQATDIILCKNFRSYSPTGTV